MEQNMPKQKEKIGVCEVHLYNYDDKERTKVKWHPQSELWVCGKCDDPVLIAMASVGKKQANENKSKTKN